MYYLKQACNVVVLSTSTTSTSGCVLLAGSAVNQDGRASSLTAPNGPAQQEVIRAALQSAQGIATQVAGLQLHGTGTSLGDPIEIGAVMAAYLGEGPAAKRPFTFLASKSHLGHSEPASGIIGLAFLHQVISLSRSVSRYYTIS